MRRTSIIGLGLTLLAALAAPAAHAQDCAPDPSTCVRFAAHNFVGPTYADNQGGVEVTLSRPAGGPAGSVIVQESEPGGDGYMGQQTWGAHNFGPATDAKVTFAAGATSVTIKWHSSAPRSSPISIKTSGAPDQLPVGTPRSACVEATAGQPAQRCKAQSGPVCPGDPSCPPPEPDCPGDPSCPPANVTCPGDPSCPPPDTTPPTQSRPVLAHLTAEELEVVLACSETRSPCVGSMSVESLRRVPVPAGRSKPARAAAMRKLKLGKVDFVIPGEKRTAVELTFSRTVKRALAYAFKKRRKIPVRLTVVMADRDGNSTTKRFTLTLKRPRR